MTLMQVSYIYDSQSITADSNNSPHYLPASRLSESVLLIWVFSSPECIQLMTSKAN